MSEQNPPVAPTFREALRFWLKLGFISFGGPAGQIAIMHDFLVDRQRWISDRKFLHALNYCMLLPGPEAQQLATYIGWLLHGTRGGLAAGILFVLPSVFILLTLSLLYVWFGGVPAISALFGGLKPAVVAIVLLALLKIGKRSLLSPLHYAVAAGAFVAVFFFNVPFPLLVLVALIVAAVAWRFYPAVFRLPEVHAAHAPDAERAYFLNRHSALSGRIFRWGFLGRQVAMLLGLWVLPLAVLRFTAPDFFFWQKLSVFFTQAAFVTFGGAYAVLPYVAQVAVQKMHWLSELQMLDGLALGETTPGPLIMVLSFVGFMAGYGHFDGSAALGALGLILTTYYTFLPSFFFIFVGAPFIERSQTNPAIQAALGLVTAAVVGVIVNLGIFLGRAMVQPAASRVDWVALAWIVVSVAALYRWKFNLIAWIGVSALFGLARWALGF